MTTELRIRDVLQRDPSQASLQNEGVSKVENTATLHYELSTFVCDGEYREGLIRILESYLNHLSVPTQVAAWVSGFYGSGKSHLVKMLEALWRNDRQIGSQLPRDIAVLPEEIRTLLIELTNESKRSGGLWTASGMLTESGDKSVRMLIMGIVYKAAGLSSDYGRARFRLWVRQRGWEEQIIERLAAAGLDPDEEFEQYLVSPEMAETVWELGGAKSTDAESAQNNWDNQFNKKDITIDEFESALREMLRLQSTDSKSIPLTLLVLDEVQQYIGERGDRAQAVQETIERIQVAFESKVLVVATGQAALHTTSNLQKLQARLPVSVMLSDRDVEEVVRQVILRKKPDHKSDVEAMIRTVEGEIDRQLLSSKIGPKSADKEILVSDYPLLPTRNRFWAAVLHAIDPTGTSAQLRSQLKMTHSGVLHVADQPLGHAIPADFIFDQLSGALRQSGTLPSEITTLIASQADEPDGTLRSRLIQLIFLIEEVRRTTEVAGSIIDFGVRATAESLADLLVEDLRLGSDDLRSQIPQVLKSLEEDGKLIRSPENSYSIQTGESLKWTQEFQKQRQALANSPGPLGALRDKTIEDLIREQAKSVASPQGVTKTPRSVTFTFGNEAPTTAAGDASVAIWVRDGWNTAEKTVVADARLNGDESPVISVFVPQRNQQEILSFLLTAEAARATVDLLGGTLDSTEAQRASDSLRHRMTENQDAYRSQLRELTTSAHVYLGGGAQVEAENFAGKLRAAVDSSLKRLFPKFADADLLGWDKVFERARDGNPKPLEAVGFAGDETGHPVIREVRKQISGEQGTLWTDLRKRFTGAPYGWPQDAIDAAVAVLVNAGAVSATVNGQDVRGRTLVKQQANATRLIGEKVFPTTTDRMQVRKLVLELEGRQINDDQVREHARALVNGLVALARSAGGEPPLPLNTVPLYLTELQDQAGNQLIIALAAQSDQISADIAAWRDREAEIAKRFPVWERVLKLSAHAVSLQGHTESQRQIDAIRDDRQLLNNPDPIDQIRKDLGHLLRSALESRFDAYRQEYDQRMTELRATDEWVRLDETRQNQYLAAKHVEVLREPAISSDQDLLTALTMRSVEQWDAVVDALPSRVNAAYALAVEFFEPQTVEISLTRPLFRTQKDVDAWIAETRNALLNHIHDGHPVRIK